MIGTGGVEHRGVRENEQVGQIFLILVFSQTKIGVQIVPHIVFLTGLFFVRTVASREAGGGLNGSRKMLGTEDQAKRLFGCGIRVIRAGGKVRRGTQRSRQMRWRFLRKCIACERYIAALKGDGACFFCHRHYERSILRGGLDIRHTERVPFVHIRHLIFQV